MKKKRARDEYLTYEDWETAKRRFEAGTQKLFADLVEFEPVLAEAVAQRSCELSKTIDAQDLTPETKVHLKAQSARKLLEAMTLMHLWHEKVMADLLPGPDFRVKTGDDETGPCKEQP